MVYVGEILDTPDCTVALSDDGDVFLITDAPGEEREPETVAEWEVIAMSLALKIGELTGEWPPRENHQEKCRLAAELQKLSRSFRASYRWLFSRDYGSDEHASLYRGVQAGRLEYEQCLRRWDELAPGEKWTTYIREEART